MPPFEPHDPHFEARVRESFARQTIMATIGATLTVVQPGAVEIRLPFRADLCQQHGFLHAGIVTTIVDSACGYAAGSLMSPDDGVLSIEFKINLLAPAIGDYFIARGHVTRAGRTIMVCSGDVLAVTSEAEKHVATMLATMMVIRGRAGIQG
jgi:uncharacterized protein (TIGR00369 family)